MAPISRFTLGGRRSNGRSQAGGRGSHRLDNDFSNAGLVDSHQPGTRSASTKGFVDVIPPADQSHQVTPGGEISLACNPEHTESMLAEERNLTWFRPDASITGDDREIAGSNSGDPDGVQRS